MNLKTINFITLVLFTICIGCERKTQNNDTNELIIEHFRLLNIHNLKDLAKQYSNDAMIRTPQSMAMGIGLVNLMRDYELDINYCKNIQFKIECIIASDSSIAVEYKIMGIPKKIAPPLITNFYPNGIDQSDCSIFRIKNKKIISETIYTNNITHD